MVPGNRESVNTVLRTSFDPLSKGALLCLIACIPFHKVPKKLLTNECSGAKYTLNHTREARARARLRARSARFSPIVRAYRLRVLARGARGPEKNNLSQNTKLGAPKRVSASAHVGSARDRRFINVCDRQRRSRHAAGRVCTRLYNLGF